MTDTPQGVAAIGGDRFDAVEAMLARYPDLTAPEIDDLKRWFRKEASAFDVASMAGKEAIATGYRAFRDDHIDRFTPRDLVTGAIIAIVGLAFAYMLLSRAF